MSDVVELAGPTMVGPERCGYAVIVEGRVIPRLHCHDLGERIEIVLDGRFSLTVRRDEAYRIAWMLAHALAIGAGYSHLGADGRDRPFAPELKQWEPSDA